ncbi:MAG: AcrR family transcriptional regulator [Halioglobus sp.]|jgi:AcrR family transcriptional regulator
METKQKILDQTFVLIMKYGIKSVSLDDISRGIGISKKTVYQYFENKKGLIQEVIENHIIKDEADIAAIITEAKDAIDEMLQVAKHVLVFLRSMSPSMMFDTQKYYPQIWERVENQHFGFILNTIIKNIERGQQEGYYCVDIDADIISKMYVRQILTLADEGVFPLSEYDRSDLYKSLVTYHVRGLLNDKGRIKAQNLELE